MKYFVYLLFSFLLLGCKGDKKNTIIPTGMDARPTLTPVTVDDGKLTAPEGKPGAISPSPSSPPTPVANDLNGDGEPDYLEVFTTTEDNDGFGLKRELIVYSGEGADRDAWYVAEEAILSTENGGMLGDPFVSAIIENGTIVIKHFGGSRFKWNYIHRYRWQNEDFQLIGATITNSAPCAYTENIDYNLSTGQGNYLKRTEDCSLSEENPETEVSTARFDKKTAPPSMDGFEPGTHEIQASGMSEAMYY